MTEKEKNILDIIQKYFPLEERPYRKIAGSLGIDEAELIKKIKDLWRKGYIKYTGAVINTSALNYESALVAFRISSKKIPAAAKIINSHPGVSHNYLRDSKEYNIWFTIAAPKGTNLRKSIDQLAIESCAESILFLPSIKTYKVRMVLDLGNATQQNVPHKKQKSPAPPFLPKKLSKKQKLILSHLQYGLPIKCEPFKKISQKTGLAVKSVLEISEKLLAKGYIKRFGTIVSHTKTGYKFNALVLWPVPLKKIDACGKILASSKNVSHCYRRQAYPNWPYSIYTMMHARNQKEFQSLLAKLSHQTKIKEFKILKTKKEFKKMRLLYFAK